MPKDYSKFSKDELIRLLSQNESRKKYGLVWEQDKIRERFETDSQRALPVLKGVKGRDIKKQNGLPFNILIEGENYHALSVLSYTHQGKIDVIYIDPPYNTGARDWKYNNDYVDKNDTYRHSKWLSMMYNRLHLARNLLKDDGVLVCAIDENERDRLGLLLEEVFSNHDIHCVTIVHNPRGVQGANFSYVHEYAFFVFRKGLKVIGHRQLREDEIYWSNFRNWGGESLRTDAKNCFYPVIVKGDKITGFGDVPKDSFHPKAQTAKVGSELHVYPIDKSGTERKWRYARQSVEAIQEFLRVKKKKSGLEIEIGKDFGTVKTVWQNPKYDAAEYGTKLVHRLVPKTHFDFPKSVYNTYDCLAPIIKERKDAIILDYFAGSGTTGHATLLLNKEDGGNRTFILITNNENGICTDVCHPRIKKVIAGHKSYPEITQISANLKYFKTAFMRRSLSKDELKVRITQECTEMLCLRESIFEQVFTSPDFKAFRQGDRIMAIYYSLDRTALKKLKKKLDGLKGEKLLYCFTLDPLGLDTTDFEDWYGVTLEPIPQKILDIYQRIYDD